MENFSVIALNGLVLPESSVIKRAFSRPVERQDSGYLTNYDRLTVAYDHWIEGNKLHLAARAC